MLHETLPESYTSKYYGAFEYSNVSFIPLSTSADNSFDLESADSFVLLPARQCVLLVTASDPLFFLVVVQIICIDITSKRVHTPLTLAP
jgi:hypothetical protein